MRYSHLIKRGGQKIKEIFHEGFAEPWELNTSGILQLWEHEEATPWTVAWGRGPSPEQAEEIMRGNSLTHTCVVS